MSVRHIVVDCDGALDAHSAGRVKRKTLPLIDGRSDVVLDLAQVDFVDSVGLGVLVSFFKAARSRGCNVNFIGVSSKVRRVLEIIRLDEIFEVHADLASASRALAGRR